MAFQKFLGSLPYWKNYYGRPSLELSKTKNFQIFQANCQISASSIFGLRAGGCFTKVVDEINKHSGIVGGIAIGVVVVMV